MYTLKIWPYHALFDIAKTFGNKIERQGFMEKWSVVNELKEKIESFRGLPKGWDMGSGERISDRIIKEAINISDMCRFPFVEKYATPNSDGGITLTFAIGEKFIDVIVNSDGSVDTQEERGFGLGYDTVNYKQGVSLDEIQFF